MNEAAPQGWDGILEPGERVLWQGRPSGDISWAGLKPKKVLFGVIFSSFALFWTVKAITMPVEAPLPVRLLVPLVGLTLLFKGAKLAGADRIWRAITRRSSRYTLTDRRAFIATDLFGRRKLRSWPITAETVIDLVDGTRSSLFFAREGSERIGFEMIEDGRAVLSLMRTLQRENT
ncbi:aspartate carbamoyltransferase catalytic subunit [Tropicimonas sp. TH_r6]|uniref:aspartate carbamoyltransferase catalytic subunit n=1 Tax=Tropicimonas sp. TH_r6 TaxID=3082085 RepID=UPI002953BE28|nr:aspartate carbamoyltransferase catalytic subunit [Tropicimonas sp. TH_r6]MDV7141318.1 aspartate carbamoyltransferase catalytic subunit [Tropicimonas sp. TH_r6]